MDREHRKPVTRERVHQLLVHINHALGNRREKVAQQLLHRGIREALIGDVRDDAAVELAELLARTKLTGKDLKVDLSLRVVMELRQVVHETVDQLDGRRALWPFVARASRVSVGP